MLTIGVAVLLLQGSAVSQKEPGWAFRPVTRPAVPAVKQARRAANPIDAFILARLEAAGLTLSPPAPPETLLRRAFLDVVGLPPTLEEQRAFLDDPGDGAYAALVERLLASPHYGERWARPWLDLVRYADTNGYERDSDKPSVWRYRDYVVGALNRDTPYDRFVMEQIAGDELDDAGVESITATGYWALGPWQDEVDPLEQPQYRADEIDDLVSTTAQTFQGISLGCARCHDHKYDPLTLVDYTGMAAIVAPLRRPNQGRTDRDLPAAPAPLREAIEARDARIAELRKRKDLSAADLQARIEELRKETPDVPRAYFLFEPSPEAPKTYLLKRGNPATPGPEVGPAVPAALVGRPPEFLGPDGRTSRRRLSLARWIASADNPLTARVIVNRVWQGHFGTGLVSTPSEFGRQGTPPTHPELLDWLADWFTHEGAWSLKRLHRLILLSATYRAGSRPDPAALRADPQNRLLSHFPLRRLDAEAIRDSILAVSGQLDRRLGGPPVRFTIPDAVIEAHTDKHAAWKNAPEADQARRTIYGTVKRTLMVPLIEALDFCDTTRSTARRPVTTIAPQALMLFNGDFVNRQAVHFADRLLHEAGADPRARIERAYRLALARPPTPAEADALLHFLQEESPVQACRVLLNLNEFVYLQ